MTQSFSEDKETAFKLGAMVINQSKHVAALHSFITEYCLTEPRLTGVDWRKIVQDNQDAVDLQKTASAWKRGLRFAIDAENQHTHLIQLLYNHLTKTNILEEE